MGDNLFGACSNLTPSEGQFLSEEKCKIMKKLFILLVFAMTLISCEKVSPLEPGVTVNSSPKPAFYYMDDGIIINHLYYICDRKTNNAYIYRTAGNRGAMTAYYDENGKIAKCNEIK